MMHSDSERLRSCYEVWHFERQSFHQAKKYFHHLSTLCCEDPDVWLCLSACYAYSDDHAESLAALNTAKKLISNPEMDVRVKFCYALLAEKRRDFNTAMEGYTTCLNQCSTIVNNLNHPSLNKQSNQLGSDNSHKVVFLREIRGEILLRMAVLKKEMNDIENAMHLCGVITNEQHGDTVKSNALCLKGLLFEVKGDFPAAEVVYRSVLQIVSNHCTALERLGRVYLRYRETIPAAVQCFFKSVETNPSNYIAWSLLGRCYMATNQYTDAWEAYNRAVNINPNDPHVWNSLGVLYYAFGQCREALGMLSRALRIDPSLAEAWYNVGALYDICEQPDDAEQAYQKSRECGLSENFFKTNVNNPSQSGPSLQHNIQQALEAQRQGQGHGHARAESGQGQGGAAPVSSSSQQITAQSQQAVRSSQSLSEGYGRAGGWTGEMQAGQSHQTLELLHK